MVEFDQFMAMDQIIAMDLFLAMDIAIFDNFLTDQIHCLVFWDRFHSINNSKLELALGAGLARLGDHSMWTTPT
jgi:hypothetical protein